MAKDWELVIGAFRSRDMAEEAISDLRSEGFDDIEMTSGESFSGGMSGSGLGAGAARDFAPDLERRGLPRDDAREYGEMLRQGYSVVSVATREGEKAAHILSSHNATAPHEMGERISPYEAGATGASSERSEFEGAGRDYTDRGTYTDRSHREGEDVVPIVEEQLHVGKRTVETGRVRLYQRVVEKPVEEQVHLHDEKVTFERRPANRPATEADFREGYSKEIRETREEPIVAKEANVVEEVVIDKEQRDRIETVKDKVRKTEVDIEGGEETRRKK